MAFTHFHRWNTGHQSLPRSINNVSVDSVMLPDYLFRTLTRGASWRCSRDLSLRTTTTWTKPSYWRLQTTGRTLRLKAALVNTTAWWEKAPAKGASETILADDLESFHVNLCFAYWNKPQLLVFSLSWLTNACYFNRCKIILFFFLLRENK